VHDAGSAVAEAWADAPGSVAARIERARRNVEALNIGTAGLLEVGERTLLGAIDASGGASYW
jgi:hypothetical protein